MLHHIQKIRLSYFKDINLSSLTQQLNADINCVVEFCFKLIENLISNILKLMMSMLFISIVNIHFTILLIIIILIYGTFYILFKNKVYNSCLKVKNNQAYYFSKIYEQLIKIKFIKINSLYHWIDNRMTNPFKVLLKSLMKLQIKSIDKIEKTIYNY